MNVAETDKILANLANNITNGSYKRSKLGNSDRKKRYLSTRTHVIVNNTANLSEWYVEYT